VSVTGKKSHKKLHNKPGFNIRKLVSLAVFLSFSGLVATGTALFTAPPGRIARWGDWRHRKSIQFSAGFLKSITGKIQR
jgi:hypothetical protein